MMWRGIGMRQGVLAAGLAMGLAAVVGAGAGQAGTITYSSCVGTGYGVSYDITGVVAGASDCAISSAVQDAMAPDAPLTVNLDGGFFGITDWVVDGKLDVNGQLIEDEATFGKSGHFDLTDYFAGWMGDVMLVFRSTQSMRLVGYLFSVTGTTDLSGDWTTPFLCGPFGWPNGKCYNSFPKDVAHISVYSRVTEVPQRVTSAVVLAPVPLPAAGGLLLAALGGMGLMRRRRT